MTDLIITAIIAAICIAGTWGFAKWYYTKDGRAQLQAKEDEVKALRDQLRGG